MRDYHTYILTNFWLSDLIEKISCLPDWELTTIIDPSLRFWISKDGSGYTEKTHPATIDDPVHAIEDTSPAIEIIIKAKDQDTADNVRNLIEAGIILAYPNASDCPKSDDSFELTEKSLELMKDKFFYKRFSFHHNALYACNAVKRAWGKKDLVYSMEKFTKSFRMDSFTPHSANPMYGQVFANERNDFRYHVNAGYAIVIGYSVIEELGLEIRSSAKNPRFINGDWNEVVYQDISERLKKAGIEPEDEFEWVLRGKRTDLQKNTWSHLHTVDYFSESHEVRDQKMSLIDAIHAASVMRNFIFAHKFDEVAQAVSPYDVFNIQILARRLILGKLGLLKTDDTNLTGLFRPS